MPGEKKPVDELLSDLVYEVRALRDDTYNSALAANPGAFMSVGEPVLRTTLGPSTAPGVATSPVAVYTNRLKKPVMVIVRAVPSAEETFYLLIHPGNREDCNTQKARLALVAESPVQGVLVMPNTTLWTSVVSDVSVYVLATSVLVRGRANLFGDCAD